MLNRSIVRTAAFFLTASLCLGEEEASPTTRSSTNNHLHHYYVELRSFLAESTLRGELKRELLAAIDKALARIVSEPQASDVAFPLQTIADVARAHATMDERSLVLSMIRSPQWKNARS